MDLNYNKISFVHISDLHIGFKFKNATFSYEKGDDRRFDLLDSLVRVVNFVKENNVDFLFITGDAFESQYISGAELADINYHFSKIETCDIIIIAGNHDPLSSVKIYKKIKWNDNVHIIREDFETIEFKEKRCLISGNAFSSQKKDALDLSRLPAVEKDYKNILLLHGNVFSNDNYCYLDKKTLLGLDYDYIGLGHIHKHEFFADNIAYAGSLEPLDFGETGEHGFIYGELADKNTFTFKDFSKRKFRKVDIELEAEDTLSSLAEKINAAISEYKDDFIRIILTGYKSISLEPSKENLSKLVRAYYFEIVDESKFDIDIEAVLESNEQGFIGEFARSFSEDELKDELVKEAYELGIRILYEEQSGYEN